MLFTVLLIKWLEKVGVVLILWKNILAKNLWWLKNIILKDFEDPAKCWACDVDYVEGDVREKVHCHITGNYTGSTHTD